MGRGRAKAKQQKVARELKYSGQNMDLDALQRELGAAHPSTGGTVTSEDDGYDDVEDDWSASGR